MMRRLFGQLGMSHKPKNPEPVIDGDGNDAFRSHAFSVIAGFGAVTRYEPATVKINKHRQALLNGPGGCPHIEVETVLTHSVGAKTHIAEDRCLHAARTKLGSLFHALPVLNRLRLFPSQLAHGRLGEWNPFENAHARAL